METEEGLTAGHRRSLAGRRSHRGYGRINGPASASHQGTQSAHPAQDSCELTFVFPDLPGHTLTRLPRISNL